MSVEVESLFMVIGGLLFLFGTVLLGTLFMMVFSLVLDKLGL